MDEHLVQEELAKIAADAERLANELHSKLVPARARLVARKIEAAFHAQLGSLAEEARLPVDTTSKAFVMATKEKIEDLEANIADLDAEIEEEVRNYYREQVRVLLRHMAKGDTR
jgi:hypothetical protein